MIRLEVFPADGESEAFGGRCVLPVQRSGREGLSVLRNLAVLPVLAMLIWNDTKRCITRPVYDAVGLFCEGVSVS